MKRKKQYKFVRIQQTYTLEAIMKVDENETEEQIVARIEEHCKNNGGCETVICCGGKITAQVTDERPSKEDFDDYEVID